MVRETHIDHHEMLEFYWDNGTVHQLMGHCIRAIKKNKGYGLGQKREVSKQTNKQTNKKINKQTKIKIRTKTNKQQKQTKKHPKLTFPNH